MNLLNTKAFYINWSIFVCVNFHVFNQYILLVFLNVSDKIDSSKISLKVSSEVSSEVNSEVSWEVGSEVRSEVS